MWLRAQVPYGLSSNQVSTLDITTSPSLGLLVSRKRGNSSSPRALVGVKSRNMKCLGRCGKEVSVLSGSCLFPTDTSPREEAPAGVLPCLVQVQEVLLGGEGWSSGSHGG